MAEPARHGLDRHRQRSKWRICPDLFSLGSVSESMFDRLEPNAGDIEHAESRDREQNDRDLASELLCMVAPGKGSPNLHRCSSSLRGSTM